MVSIVGIAGVVMIFVGVLSIGEGFRRTLELAGSDRGRGHPARRHDFGDGEQLPPDQVQLIEQGPGVAKRCAVPSHPLSFSPPSTSSQRSTGTPANAPLRGIEPAGMRTREHFKLTSRDACSTTGRNEVIVGRGSGATLERPRCRLEREVGQQHAGRSSACSRTMAVSRSPRSGRTRAFCRARTRSAARSRRCARGWNRPRPSPRSRMGSPADPRLNVTVQTEQQFYAEQSSTLTAIAARGRHRARAC